FLRWKRRLIEIRRQRGEIDGVDRAIEIEIALAPQLAATTAEVRGQRVEVQRIYQPVEVRVAAPGVADEHVCAGHALAIKNANCKTRGGGVAESGFVLAAA